LTIVGVVRRRKTQGAKAMGLTIPEAFLLPADVVLE
jgi:hypothetical protein